MKTFNTLCQRHKALLCTFSFILLVFSNPVSSQAVLSSSGPCNSVAENFNSTNGGYSSIANFAKASSANDWTGTITASGAVASLRSSAYYLTPSVPTANSVVVGFKLSGTITGANPSVTISVRKHSDNSLLATGTFTNITANNNYCYSLTDSRLVNGIMAYYQFDFTGSWSTGGPNRQVTFDDFSYGGNSNSPLPVEFGDFISSRLNNKDVLLKWNTLTEINNTGFEIQRRYMEKGEFETIGFVASKSEYGNSETALQYEYKDLNTSSASSFYRIKQIDLDGKSKYTPIRIVNGVKSSMSSLVYPNPSANGNATIIFNNTESRNIQVLDMSGRQLKNWNSYSSQELKLETMKPGMYMIVIQNTMNGEREVQRLVVSQ